MNGTQVADAPQLKRDLLLVCDPNGRIQAASAEVVEQSSGVNLNQQHFSDIFGQGSNISEWFSEQVDKARGQDDYSAQSSIESSNVRVSIATLRRDGELFGY